MPFEEAINTAKIHKFILKPWENDQLLIHVVEAHKAHKVLVEKEKLKQLSITDPITQLTHLQCAAVMTMSGLINTPPQNCCCVSFNKTKYGNRVNKASDPPTTRSIIILLFQFTINKQFINLKASFKIKDFSMAVWHELLLWHLAGAMCHGCRKSTEAGM